MTDILILFKPFVQDDLALAATFSAGGVSTNPQPSGETESWTVAIEEVRDAPGLSSAGPWVFEFAEQAAPTPPVRVEPHRPLSPFRL